MSTPTRGRPWTPALPRSARLRAELDTIVLGTRRPARLLAHGPAASRWRPGRPSAPLRASGSSGSAGWPSNGWRRGGRRSRPTRVPRTPSPDAGTRRLAWLTLAALDGLFLARLSDPAEDVAEPLRLLATGSGRGGPRSSRPAASPLAPSRASYGVPHRDRRRHATGGSTAARGRRGRRAERLRGRQHRAHLPAGGAAGELALLALHRQGRPARPPSSSTPTPSGTPPSRPGVRPPRARRGPRSSAATSSVSLGSLADQPIFLRLGYLLLLLRRDDPPGRQGALHGGAPTRAPRDRRVVPCGAESRTSPAPAPPRSPSWRCPTGCSSPTSSTPRPGTPPSSATW